MEAPLLEKAETSTTLCINAQYAQAGCKDITGLFLLQLCTALGSDLCIAGIHMLDIPTYRLIWRKELMNTRCKTFADLVRPSMLYGAHIVFLPLYRVQVCGLPESKQLLECMAFLLVA